MKRIYLRRTGSAKRLWGSDVIAGLYGLAACIVLGSLPKSAGSLRALLLVLFAGFVALSLGLFFRVNAIRVVLIWLLGSTLVLGIAFFLYLVAGLAGWTEMPPNIDPSKQITRVISNWLVTAGMLFYLLGTEVRAEYQRSRVGTDTPSEEPPENPAGEFED